ncbi:efflux RND transporter permease subunit [Stieleria varia]|uniref:Nickel and cobalt resistance protein CnrA n=1 Tax=Stieleria varia TaxID=2528005 RepID=A0A5C6AVD1_9BACT|nr:efflux RND transporter permease subunit [Stieleria varia]TWU03002.1 Nickel and cobalt resistance protein CnrA [Stieleria varia]
MSEQASHAAMGDWSTLFYRNTRAMFLVLGMVAVSGLTSLSLLPRMEDPVIGQRAGLVATRMPGADAQRIEVLVTEPLEERLQEVEQIKKITSDSRPGISTISIELREEVMETDEVWSDVRAKINDAIADLPPEAARPVFDEIDVRAYALITAICWQDGTPPNWTILRRLAKQLEDDLRAIPGTEIVDRFADPGEEITVELDPDQAARLALSAADVARAMNASDAKNSAGLLHAGDNDVVIELANQFLMADRIGETLIRSGRDGEMVRLSDVATVRRGTPDPLPRMAIVDSMPAVSLGVLVRPGERIDLWRPKVQETLDDFAAQLPAGVTLDIPLDQSHYVEQRLSSLAVNLVLGATAVVFVVLLLMGWRNAIVVALSLPLSALTVLFGLRVLEIPIHQMSVTGMIIAMGLLIDNAIVAVDEVTVGIRKGKSRIDAVRDMVNHLALPLAGSTATTALAFAPIAMMPGNAGEFVGSISVSVILAISASLFFALTIIPVVAARFTPLPDDEFTRQRKGALQRIWQSGVSSRRMTRVYKSTLQWLLVKPYRAIVLGLVLPVMGFAVASQLPEQFFPPADRNQFHIQLELPVDASITATAETAERISQMVSDAGAVKISWYFGESAPMFYYNVINNRRGVPSFANAIVQMKSAEGIGETLRTLQKRADELVSDGRVLFRQLEQGPPFDAPIEIRLFGPDLDRLAEIGDEVRLALASAPDVIHTKSPLNETLPTITFDVREADARLAGLQPSDVSSQLYDLLEGVRAGSILEDTEQIPVVVRVGNQRRSKVQAIHSLQLQAAGRQLPIESVADVSLQSEIAVIPRLNRRRMNLISGFITAGTLPSVSLAEFERRLEQRGFELPNGYTMEYGGEASQRNDAVGNLMANVGVLAVMMVAVLVLSFGSFRLAGMILVVAACSGGLGMLALWIGGYPFGFMAIIGIMGLIGVAINDSIVVLAALQQRSSEQVMTLSTVIDTITDCTRHVIATTLTTIAGFTPLIIDGGQFWPPLAFAIAGGVSGATLLALAFVPAVYRSLGNGIRQNSPAALESTPRHHDAYVMQVKAVPATK